MLLQLGILTFNIKLSISSKSALFANWKFLFDKYSVLKKEHC